MKINNLIPRNEIDENDKLCKAFDQFQEFILILNKRELPQEVTEKINDFVKEINECSASDLKSQLRKSQAKVVQLLEKELKMVPINHHRKTWLAIGMAAIGIPIGVSFGISLGNMAFIGIGLPIGMAIGLGVGTKMDKAAKAEGRQLEIELIH